ncbi:MAG: hypothetical protein MUP70_01375 [Candidatus Aminicenantes bacterium]|nr:hypothetical protein [Candidatus Aminicenantes bacterium]
MNKKYEPDSKFVEQLEWQLTSEYRRTNHLKSAPLKIAFPRWVVAMTVAVGVLLTSVAMIKAAEVIRDNWRKKIEVARLETDVELNRVHLASIQEISIQVKEQAENGVIHPEEYLAMKAAVAKAELNLKRSMLNLDEVKTSGDIPRDELFAPLVRGRDFVSERLKLDALEVTLDMEQMEGHKKRMTRLVEENLVREDERMALEAEVVSLQAALIKIKDKLDLRKQFLAGGISAGQVEIAGRLTEAEKKQQGAKSRVDTVQAQMNRLKDLESRGMINTMELKQMEYELSAAKAELKLATLEIEVLQKVK